MSNKPLELQVIVVGAGMAGLATAISLRKIGCKVTVLEQAPEFGEVRVVKYSDY
jgi:salicylate hydroxylase